MNTINRFTLVAMACALAACGGGGDDTAAAPFFPGFPGGAVTLQFAAQAGNAPVACGTDIAALGTGRVSARLQDLRLHIANVSFVKADGSLVPMTLALKPTDEFWNAVERQRQPDLARLRGRQRRLWRRHGSHQQHHRRHGAGG